MQIRNIALISGINDTSSKDPMWNNLADGFRTSFPHAIISMHRALYYPLPHVPLGYDDIRSLGERVREAHARRNSILLVGHSMGGIVALCESLHIRGTVGIVTIFSPITTFGGKFSREIYGGTCTPRAPIVSFEAAHDWIVWSGTRHPDAVHHEVLNCGHWIDLMRKPELSVRIAAVTKRYLVGPE